MRTVEEYQNGVMISTSTQNISWEILRHTRNEELKATDHWALSDRIITDEQRDYRIMLRDLPSDFPGDDANDASDHWNANPRPEGA
tara:strand:- start:45 stop:302 length:258 start_codon:yes stop_codon:yes gene_type:complete